MLEERVSQDCFWGITADPCECGRIWIGNPICEYKVFNKLNPTVMGTIINVALNRFLFDYQTALEIAKEGSSKVYLRFFENVLNGKFDRSKSTKRYVEGIARNVAFELCKEEINRNKRTLPLTQKSLNEEDGKEADAEKKPKQSNFIFEDLVSATFPEDLQLDENKFALFCCEAHLTDIEIRLLELYTTLANPEKTGGKPRMKAATAAEILAIQVKEVYRLNESIKRKISYWKLSKNEKSPN